MKLYSKRLNSLEELKREKHVLKYALKHSGSEDWLDLNNLVKSKSSKTEDAAEAGILGTLISAVGSKSLFNTVLAMAPPLLTMVSKSGKQRKSGFVERAVKEVITGYIKWKAIQMAYRGVTMFVSSKKEHKEEKVTVKHRKEKERV